MLTELRIRGFKAIYDSQAISLGDLTLLIGRNGSGKSSVVEALQWLQESVFHGLQQATESRFGSLADLRNRRARDISLTLDHQKKRFPHVRYELAVGGQTKPVVYEEKCREGRTSGARLTISSRKGKRGPAVRSIRGGNPVRDGDTLAVARTTHGPPGAGRILSMLTGAVFLRLNPVVIARPGPLRVATRSALLDEEGYGLEALLLSLSKKQLSWVIETLAEVVEGIEDVEIVERDTDASFGLIERMRSRGGTRPYLIPSTLLSEGVRRLVAILALLAHEPRPSLLAIEEVENGLDPWTLQVVLSELQQAASEGTQVLLTTHSPYLLDHVFPEQVIHVQRSGGETTFTPIVKYDEVQRYEGEVPPGVMYTSDYFGVRTDRRKKR